MATLDTKATPTEAPDNGKNKLYKILRNVLSINLVATLSIALKISRSAGEKLD